MLRQPLATREMDRWFYPLILLAAAFPANAQDCAIGRVQLTTAKEQISAAANTKAIAALQQALDACPGYEANQLLGTLLAESPRSLDRKRAVEAFVAAHELAPSDATRAETLFEYAQLLKSEDDPQNAYSIIKEAQRLDATSTKFAALASELDVHIRNPTPKQLVRGLKDSLYKPLRIASLPATAVSAMPRPNEARLSGPSINVPLHFVVGSTVLDDESLANFSALKDALADPSLTNRKFIFIGHADARGASWSNMILSIRRAEAILQSLISTNPTLQGRVEVTGRGEDELIELGTDEQAHRANRRLQVQLQ